MFENYAESKRSKGMTWAIALLGIVVTGHVAFGAVLVAKSLWTISKLEPPGSGVDLAIAPPPPPPPPPPPKSKKLETQKKVEPKKIKPTETVQPTKPEEKPQEVASDDEGDPDGEEGGEVGGQAGGVAGGVPSAPAPSCNNDGLCVQGCKPVDPDCPPPPPTAPSIVPPNALEQSRISGEKNIFPDDVTKTEISRSGKTRLMIPVKVCIDRLGAIAGVTIVGKGSGFSAYDEKLKREIRKWKYRPFSINGQPAPVCSIVQFVYNQK
jgi:protein TonB